MSFSYEPRRLPSGDVHDEGDDDGRKSRQNGPLQLRSADVSADISAESSTIRGLQERSVEASVEGPVTSVPSIAASLLDDNRLETPSSSWSVADPPFRVRLRQLARRLPLCGCCAGFERHFSCVLFGLVLLLHTLMYSSNIALLVFLFVNGEFGPFAFLLTMWLIVSLFCAVEASREQWVKRLPLLFRYPLVFVVLGLFQFIQFKTIFDYYDNRDVLRRPLERHGPISNRSSAVSDPLDAPSVHTRRPRDISKRSDLFQCCLLSFPFAATCLNALSWTKPRVPRHVVEYNCLMRKILGKEALDYIEQTQKYKALFLVCLLVNTLCLTRGIVEIDRRVSNCARHKLNTTGCRAFWHWMYRLSEIIKSVATVVGLSVTIHLMLAVGPHYETGPSYDSVSNYLVSNSAHWPIFAVIMIGRAFPHIVIFAQANPEDAPREYFTAYFYVGIVGSLTNPAKFLDTPGYISAARKVNFRISVYRRFEEALLIVLVGVSFVIPTESSSAQELLGVSFAIPTESPCAQDHTLGAFMMECFLVYWFFLVGAVVHTIIHFTQRDFRGVLGGNEVQDNTAIEIIPPAEDADRPEAVSTRLGAIYSLSNHLLEASTGLEEFRGAMRFQMRKVIGKGAYGVVVLVRETNASVWDSMCGRQLALKMQNVDSQSNPMHLAMRGRDVIAARERDIMLRLTDLDHPFIVKLVYHFEVPNREYQLVSGEPIEDCCEPPNRIFHKAIMMEYCSHGDLQEFVLKSALSPSVRTNPEAAAFFKLKSLSKDMGSEEESEQDAVEWLIRVRRFVAELAKVLEFLHDKDILFRDLKPSNVLLKLARSRASPGKPRELHVCLTDFGMAKNPQPQDPTQSIAGSPSYAAPEILKICSTNQQVPYTNAVDIFSLGRVLLVLLWRTKLFREVLFDGSKAPEELRMPLDAEWSFQSRIPPEAKKLILKLTQDKPERRGSLSGLEQDAFFGPLTYREVDLPGLDWDTLVEDAR